MKWLIYNVRLNNTGLAAAAAAEPEIMRRVISRSTFDHVIGFAIINKIND